MNEIKQTLGNDHVFNDDTRRLLLTLGKKIKSNQKVKTCVRILFGVNIYIYLFMKKKKPTTMAIFLLLLFALFSSLTCFSLVNAINCRVCTPGVPVGNQCNDPSEWRVEDSCAACGVLNFQFRDDNNDYRQGNGQWLQLTDYSCLTATMLAFVSPVVIDKLGMRPIYQQLQQQGIITNALALGGDQTGGARGGNNNFNFNSQQPQFSNNNNRNNYNNFGGGGGQSVSPYQPQTPTQYSPAGAGYGGGGGGGSSASPYSPTRYGATFAPNGGANFALQRQQQQSQPQFYGQQQQQQQSNNRNYQTFPNNNNLPGQFSNNNNNNFASNGRLQQQQQNNFNSNNAGDYFYDPSSQQQQQQQQNQQQFYAGSVSQQPPYGRQLPLSQSQSGNFRAGGGTQSERFTLNNNNNFNTNNNRFRSGNFNDATRTAEEEGLVCSDDPMLIKQFEVDAVLGLEQQLYYEDRQPQLAYLTDEYRNGLFQTFTFPDLFRQLQMCVCFDSQCTDRFPPGDELPRPSSSTQTFQNQNQNQNQNRFNQNSNNNFNNNNNNNVDNSNGENAYLIRQPQYQGQGQQFGNDNFGGQRLQQQQNQQPVLASRRVVREPAAAAASAGVGAVGAFGIASSDSASGGTTRQQQQQKRTTVGAASVVDAADADAPKQPPQRFVQPLKVVMNDNSSLTTLNS